jgi:hypothetical protein
MKLVILLVTGLVLLASPRALAELRGVELYERGEYAQARKALEGELRSPALSKEDRVKARLYLAAALHASGAEESATIQLEELVLTSPNLKVDPILFPPDFVAIAEQARARVEADRQARAKAEAQAAQPPAQASPPIAEAEGAGPPPGSTRLRPEVFGFVDPLGSSYGFGGGLSLGLGSLELSARVLLGAELAIGAEAGLLLGSGTVRPRLALRGTAIPGLSGYGGGAVAGVRLTTGQRITFLADVGAEYLKVPEAYRGLAVTGSVGVGFELF